jgi:hypothetical protein
MSSHVPGYADHARAKTLADASLIIIGALVLGVGLVSSGVVRHLVQTAPSWLTVYFGLRRCTEAKWSALPSFVFWLLIVIAIWLYLLGIAKIVTGHFTMVEIAMTIIVGIACVFGIVQSLRIRSGTNWISALLISASVTAIQLVVFRLSQIPGVANH